MSNLGYILTGGFMKGYRTYILAALAVLTAAANYMIGTADLAATITAIVTALSAITAAKHENGA